MAGRVFALALAALLSSGADAQTRPDVPRIDLPRIETRGGRHALIVDGAPFLMLAAQVNNSSNYPAPLAKVWPVMDRLGVNTVEVPVAWEQVEPVEGRFDFSFVDTVLAQARERGKRLVLLWFGTWKNTGPNYAPLWVRTDPARFPHMVDATGGEHYVLSPHARTTLEADKRAFVRLMRHLRAVDPQNTVIMVQVENEVGSYRSPRDFSPEANRLFAGPVPAALAKAMGKGAGSWPQVFGRDAPAMFHAWYTARYIDAIAAAGQAEKALPMYVNAALPADATGSHAPETFASGGPVPAAIPVYKVAAPHIAVAAPDIYVAKHATYLGFLDAYARPDNPLFVPETSNAAPIARFFYAAVGRGAIGFAPFGMDATGYSNYPLGAKAVDDATIAAFAAPYRLFGQLARVWPRLALNGRTWGVAEPDDPAASHEQVVDLGRWRASVTFGRPQFGFDPPKGNDPPSGGVAIAELAPDDYLVAGEHARVSFDRPDPSPREGWLIARVEEGHYDAAGAWVFERVWNGDQTDYGLNLGEPTLLRVRLATYEKVR